MNRKKWKRRLEVQNRLDEHGRNKGTDQVPQMPHRLEPVARSSPADKDKRTPFYVSITFNTAWVLTRLVFHWSAVYDLFFLLAVVFFIYGLTKIKKAEK